MTHEEIIAAFEEFKDEDAYAYLVLEKSPLPDLPWARPRLFLAHWPSREITRDEVWEREILWRDPNHTKIIPLYQGKSISEEQVAEFRHRLQDTLGFQEKLQDIIVRFVREIFFGYTRTTGDENDR